MQDFWRILTSNNTAMGSSHTLQTIILSLLLAFILGQVLAWVYCWTHSGLSFSRSFAQSLIVLTIVVSLVMIVVDNSIVTAFGLIGALAIIRFRNVLKDTRDTAYIFACLVVGMGVGSQRYEAAVIGTLALVLVIFYIHFTAFGSRGHFDGYLRCRLAGQAEENTTFLQILKRYCSKFRQLSRRQSQNDALVDYTFQLRLRDVNRLNELALELESLDGIEDVSLVLQEDLAEV